jgi:Zn-finger nucleic acid-binding protein
MGRWHAGAEEFLAELEQSLGVDGAASSAELVPPGHRPCPICGQMMKADAELGVSIDVCEEHGVWLDRGELRAIVAKVRSAERISRTRLIEHARRKGKVSGAVWGVWSLLFD